MEAIVIITIIYIMTPCSLVLGTDVSAVYTASIFRVKVSFPVPIHIQLLLFADPSLRHGTRTSFCLLRTPRRSRLRG